MQVRLNAASDDILLELNDSNGRLVITDEQNGELTMYISATDTAALDFTQGVYDMEIEYANGVVDRILYGNVKLSKEVTR